MDADYHFVDRGWQYYVAARSTALAQLVPVCGNLYHHAIEMLLKAHLSRKLELGELRSYGHNLVRLWTAFKEQAAATDLSQLDQTITALHRFENLRYPDAVVKEGAQIMFDWDPHPISAGGGPISATLQPQYRMNGADIDRLVAKIFEVSEWNPVAFTGMMNAYARDAITRHNPVSSGWFQ